MYTGKNNTCSCFSLNDDHGGMGSAVPLCWLQSGARGEAAGAGRLAREQDKPGNGASRCTWCGQVE